VAVADVNSDGKPDIIVTNYIANNVGVLLNSGTGTFTAPTTYSTGSASSPRSVAVVDVNSDSKPDIIVANSGTKNVGVLLNSGNGTFTVQTTYSTGTDSWPVFVAVVDVNSDSKPDVIIANYYKNNVGVLLNSGTGTSTAPTTYSTGSGSNPVSVAVVDINSDGKPDIIVANYGTNNVGVLLNSGNGTFTPQTTYSTGTGSNPIGVAVVDVNSDGKADIIVANQGTNNVGVLLNSGTGTFTVQTTYSTGTDSSPYSVTAVDVNSDSKPDIIIANQGTNNVGVLLNSGTGTFTAQSTYSTGTDSSPYSVTVVDVNSDSKPDIIVANYDTNNVGVLLNSGTSTFTAQANYSTGFDSSPYSVTVVDVNSDSKPDIIVANSGTNNVGVLLNSGTGTFTAQTTYSTGTGSYPESVAVADVNSDSKPDIIVANQGTSNVGVLLNSGNGTFTAQRTYSSGIGSNPTSVAVIDINSDGKPDIIVANYGTNNVGVLLNSGNGTFTAQTTYSTGTGSLPRSVAVVDVNSDSKPDIIVANYIANNVGVLLNSGNGTFTAQTTYSTGTGSAPYSVALFDVNSDSKPDIIVANYDTNNVGVLLNSGTGTFTVQTTYSTGTGSYPDSVAVVDVNSDGKPDIIVANYGTNNVGVLLNSGTGTFTAPTTYSTGTGSYPYSVVVVDVNSDSKPDIIVANSGTNNVGVLLHC
jgi:hypothetical protein